jgi:hypothetical protein
MRVAMAIGSISVAAMAATMGVAADKGQAGLPSSFLTPGDARKVTKEQICAPDRRYVGAATVATKDQ